MRDRNLRVLEFTKIRDMLSSLAISDMGKERIQALTPSSDPEEVRDLQQQTEEAGTVIAYTGGNPMLSFTDVREHLKRAAIGATLNPKALLEVAESLRAARGVRSALVTDRETTPLITIMGSSIHFTEGSWPHWPYSFSPHIQRLPSVSM